MPLPRALARFNRRVTNPVLGVGAPYLPGFGVVVHRGRRSGREYRTTVNVFPRPGGFVIALTYGASTDWVRNVVAQGGCALETRGRRYRLVQPRIQHDGLAMLPAALRPLLGRLVGVRDVLDLTLPSA